MMGNAQTQDTARVVSSSLIKKGKLKKEPEFAKKNDEGRWILPDTYKSARRTMFRCEEDYQEYRLQTKRDIYLRACAKTGVDPNARRGPKGPWKYSTCPTCGKYTIPKAKEEVDLEDAESDRDTADHEAPYRGGGNPQPSSPEQAPLADE